MKTLLLAALFALPAQLTGPELEKVPPIIVKCPGGICAVPEEKLQAMIEEVIDLRRALGIQCSIMRGA